MPRTSWKGFLKLSLVSVPVKAYTAHNTAEEIRLNQLHRDCHNRIRYRKVCPEHGEVQNDEIVSGYEYAKDHYVVIDPEEVQKLRAESDKAVHIAGFIKPEAVDPIYLAGKTHYLVPDGMAGNRPYVLLKKGMQEAGVCAIARVVMAGREQLILLRPDGELLTMTALHHAKQIKAADQFREEAPPDEKASKEELSLASTLIEASTLEDFDLAEYPDSYVENLSQLIEAKVEGKEIVAAPEPEEPKIFNLMEALKKSVAEAQASASRKMAPSTKADRKSAGASDKKQARKKKTG